jgi:hemerythrin
MAFFEWEDSFSVSIAEIDQQHRQLIKLVNQLHEAIERSNDLATMAAVMSELDTTSSAIDEMVDYARVHFATEENYMLRYVYPEYDSHKNEHQEFIDKVQTFRSKFEKTKTRLSLDITEFLKTWWRRHILAEDRRCGAFLNEAALR